MKRKSNTRHRGFLHGASDVMQRLAQGERVLANTIFGPPFFETSGGPASESCEL